MCPVAIPPLALQYGGGVIARFLWFVLVKNCLLDVCEWVWFSFLIIWRNYEANVLNDHLSLETTSNLMDIKKTLSFLLAVKGIVRSQKINLRPLHYRTCGNKKLCRPTVVVWSLWTLARVFDFKPASHLITPIKLYESYCIRKQLLAVTIYKTNMEDLFISRT